MKRIGWIGITVLLALAACNRPYDGSVETRHGTSLQTRATSLPTIASQTLSAIDSLMWRQPDSALACLIPYFDTCCRDVSRNVSKNENDIIFGDVSGNVSTTTEYENHYANLLLAELLYKNDYAQANRTELLRAVDYFDSLCGCRDAARHVSTNPNIAFLDARAHYINGVGYYENDSAVEACKEYLKALEVMEERFEEKELVGKKARFVAFTYTRLTDLFSNLYLHEQAIYFAHRSLAYYNRPNTPSWFTARMLNEIGSQYDMIEQLDSAVCYYQKAKEALDNTSSLLYRDIAAHIIYLEYKEGVCCADTSVKRLHQLLQNAESDRERQSRFLNIGETFFHEQRYDSAWVYLNEIFQTTSVVGLKRQAAEWLVEISKVQGREGDILPYANYLVPYANQEENQSSTKSELTEQYKTFGQARLKREQKQEMRRHYRLALSFVLGLLVVMLILVLLYQRNKRRKKQLETLIETERNAHKIQQAALSGRLKRSNAALKEKEIKNYTEITFKQNHYNQAENYFDEPICQWILSTCNDESNPIKSSIPVSSYANNALTDAQKAELKKAALAHYSPLFVKLEQQYPELKEKDYLYCYLCLLGLNNAQIAVMTQLSYRTVWEREKRLQQIFHKKKRISIILHEMMIN